MHAKICFEKAHGERLNTGALFFIKNGGGVKFNVHVNIADEFMKKIIYATKSLAEVKRKQMRPRGLGVLLHGKKSGGKSRSAIITSARYA